MNRIDFSYSLLIFSLTLLLFSCTAVGSSSENNAEPGPNIVLILADDLGWRDLGVMGSSFYETEAIDGLAKEGLLFTQAYAAAPVCTPTRAALMTGKAPARLHTTAVFDRDRGEMPLVPPDWTPYLPQEETTLAERLQSLGYVTAIMGKWHLGTEEELWPEHQGFDVNIAGWTSGRPASYFPPYENPRLPDGPKEEYLTDRLAKEADDFIHHYRDSTFFLYLPFYSPHSPFEAPESAIAPFKDKAADRNQKNPVYAAMIARLDAAVARVINALQREGLNENTLVIFTSDNGGVHTLWDEEVTDNSPLRGEKFLLYEGGIRVPLIVKWPGRIPSGKTTDQLAVTHDLHTTLVHLAGGHINDSTLDGLNLSRVFLEGNNARFERELAWHYPHYMPRQKMKPSSAYRQGPFKLVHWHEDHRLELFDLASDPGEQLNLASSLPEKALDLYGQLDDWRLQVGAQMPRPNPAYPVR